MEPWILKMLRSRSRRRVLAWAAVFAGVLAFAYSQSRYIDNFIHGPFDVGPAELDEIKDVATTPHYFVHVRGSGVVDTGLEQIEIHKTRGVETSRSVAARFYLLNIGEKALLCRGTMGASREFEGSLGPIDGELGAKLLTSRGVAAAQSKLYPYSLDTGSFRLPGYIAIGVFVVLLVLFARSGIPSIRSMRDPAAHPLVTRASRWGDLRNVSGEVEREAAAPKLSSANGWMITENYMIRSSALTFDVLRLEDLLWAHKKVIKRRVNFVPAGKTFQSIFHFLGGNAVLQAREAGVNEALKLVAQRVPWAAFGYSAELSTRFRKNTQEFVQAVAQRRQEWAKTQRVEARK